MTSPTTIRRCPITNEEYDLLPPTPPKQRISYGSHIPEMSQSEMNDMFRERIRAKLKITAEQFIANYNAGIYGCGDGCGEYPPSSRYPAGHGPCEQVMDLVMMIPQFKHIGTDAQPITHQKPSFPGIPAFRPGGRKGQP